MKALIVLLASVALAYGFPHLNLKPIIYEAHKLTQEMEGCDSVFVKDLKNGSDSCEPEFFCQAEKVLTEVKKSNAATCNPAVNKLIRNLNIYNNKTNCTVPTKGDEVIIRSFLKDLTQCAKKVFAKMPPTPRSKLSQ